MLNEGTFLNNRYEVVERIGTGGMADVYRGRDHKLKRMIAIKVLKLEFSEDMSFLKKFQIEAEAAAGMMHPNVVNVYDVGEDSGYNYMVMELIEGITLKDYIMKKGRLSDKEVISIAIQMAAGLDAVHSKDLVHRDVKPQNVMISTDGKVKVTDFGIAKPTSSDTVNANAMGSVHYTSPEQARGGACNIHSDIYSTGITIYEMITGVMPFDGETTVAIAIKHLQEDMLPPSEYVPDIYYSLERIIIKCTQKNPERRYENMKALIRDLKRALADPDGDFVNIGPSYYYNDPLQENKYDEFSHDYQEDYGDDSYEEQEYQDNYENDDEYEDEYDEDYQEEDGDEKMKKITKILTIVVALIMLFTSIYIAGKAVGFFKFGSGEQQEQQQEETQQEETKQEETNSLIEVPSVEGLTQEEAKETLNAEGLGFAISAYEESPIYDKGLITKQNINPGDKVEKNTPIKVTISNGLLEVTVTIPNVVGKSESTAQSELNGLGLKVDTQTAYSDTVEQGTVISTSPEGGTEIEEEGTVQVIISMGEEKIEVPNIGGQSKNQAETTLNNMGLEPSATEEFSDSVIQGNVISQEQAVGTKVSKGSTVNFVVSKGPEIITVSMPNVIGMAEESAVSLLREEPYNFQVDVSDVYSDAVAEGNVISSSISTGTVIEPGTTVTLVISIGVQELPQPEVQEEPDVPTEGEVHEEEFSDDTEVQ